jgi:hypothetical protein
MGANLGPYVRYAIVDFHLKPQNFNTKITKLGVLYVLYIITASIYQKF